MAVKILYAEDDKNQRSMITEYVKLWDFTEEGYELLICESGQEAESTYLSERPVRAAILDNTMPPGKTGLEIAEMIKHDDPGVKICLTTANSLAQKGEYVDDLLIKPFSPQRDLLPVLKKYFDDACGGTLMERRQISI